ncbi:MAG TPA: M20/M25/M40 family metallo-hydrolase, partial [Thermoanaerobaculia bacterium]|nr:M20/M25/M40 family metallo-hydrolase [Thermoanaerobaculia bacterium]
LLLAALALLLVRRRAGGCALPPLTPAQQTLRDELRRDVVALAGIGERHLDAPENLAAAAEFVERSFAPQRVERQSFEAGGIRVDNLIVQIDGASSGEEIGVIGAHYDTVEGTPGADDNASGVAALLALARRLADAGPRRTLRFVAFVNEEPPQFQTRQMGSWRYAQRCRDRGERIAAMLSLEMLGYYDARRGAQSYPRGLEAFYPDRGDFLAVAGNLRSHALVRRCARAFRRASPMPLQSAAVPELVPYIGWSDQWAFWQFGWPAVMITDTALFRNPHYHMPSDTPDTLDYERLARVVDGLEQVVRELAV